MAIEFNFVETDTQKIHDEVINSLMDSVNEPLYPGDERRIYGEALVMVLVSLYNDMNDAARQRTLQYARGYVLDAIGERVNTSRLMPTPFLRKRWSLMCVKRRSIRPERFRAPSPCRSGSCGNAWRSWTSRAS